jgi:putative endonuclease
MDVLKAIGARLRPKKRAGAHGEELACRFLESHGYEIVARNFGCRAGEIDIVARKDGRTVFIEVKERRKTGHGSAMEAVPREKRYRVIRAAKLYAMTRGLSESALRFDVIAVDWSSERRPRVRHEINAFDSRGL